MGHFRLLHGYNLYAYSHLIMSCGHFEGSTKFLRPSVHEIWIFWLFCSARVFPANRLWPKICHLLFLALLESYNQFLKRKWIYMEVHMGGNSAPRVHKNFTKSRFCVHSYYLLFSCKRFLYSRHRTVSNHQSSFI